MLMSALSVDAAHKSDASISLDTSAHAASVDIYTPVATNSTASTTSCSNSDTSSLLLLVSFNGGWNLDEEEEEEYKSSSPSSPSIIRAQGMHKIRVNGSLLESLEPLNASACSLLLKQHIPELENQRFHLEVYNPENNSYEEFREVRSRSNHKSRLMILVVDDNVQAAGKQHVIEGKAFSIVDDKVPFGSKFLQINTLEGDREAQDGATGMSTWDAAVVLAKYLEQNPHLVGAEGGYSGKERTLTTNVLELGAGTGLAGIAAASLGAKRTVLTDLSYTLENLRSNVVLNSYSDNDDGIIPIGADVVVTELDWSRVETYLVDDTKWDVILAADVVWLAHLVPPLLKAIEAHVSENTELIISHQMRSTACDSLLFTGLAKIFDCEQVPVSAHHHEFRSQKIDIYRCRRRPQM